MPAYVQSSVRVQPDVPLRATAFGSDGEDAAFVTMDIGSDSSAVTIFVREPGQLDRLAAVIAEARAKLVAAQSKAVA